MAMLMLWPSDGDDGGGDDDSDGKDDGRDDDKGWLCVQALKIGLYVHHNLDRFPASLEKQVGWWNWLITTILSKLLLETHIV